VYPGTLIAIVLLSIVQKENNTVIAKTASPHEQIGQVNVSVVVRAYDSLLLSV